MNPITFNTLNGVEKGSAILEEQRKELQVSSIPSTKKRKRESSNLNYIQLIPEELIQKIFYYLHWNEHHVLSAVNKEWKLIVEENVNCIIKRDIAIDKEKWNNCFGDIGEEPPLPKNIHQILKSPCPAFLGKTVAQTHLLVLIPEKVNNQPLSINTLGKLVKSLKHGNKTCFQWIAPSIFDKYGNKPGEKSSWVLLTKNVLEESRDKSYIEQVTLAATFAKKIKVDYQLPRFLEISTCIFMNFINSGERIFEKDYVRTQDTLGIDSVISVGDYSYLSYLYVAAPFTNISHRNGGIAVIRRF